MIKIQYDDERGIREYHNMNQVFYENLMERKVNFVDLTERYTMYLQALEDAHIKQVSEIDLPLIDVVFPSKHLTDKQKKDAIARYLVKYERFRNAPIWNELEAYIVQNKININGDYYRDLYLKDSGTDE